MIVAPERLSEVSEDSVRRMKARWKLTPQQDVLEGLE